MFDKIKEFGSKIVRQAGPKIDWKKVVKPIGMPNPFAVDPTLKDRLKSGPTVKGFFKTPGDYDKLRNTKPKDPNWKAPPPGVIHPTNGPKISISDFNKIKGHLK